MTTWGARDCTKSFLLRWSTDAGKAARGAYPQISELKQLGRWMPTSQSATGRKDGHQHHK